MYEAVYKVRYHEVGPDGAVPLWVLQNYFQEAAGIDAHSFAFGWEELSPKGIAWVLTRMQFKLSKKLLNPQEVKIKTWHTVAEKVQSRRDFIIYDAQGGEVARGASWWLILDLGARKIRRLPKELIDMNPANPPPCMEYREMRAPSFESRRPLSAVSVIARLEDIDTNGHVNNTHFTAWALSGVPAHIRASLRLEDVFINFKAEIMESNNITVKTYDIGSGAYWHILTRESDGKEISAVYTLWK
jgi:medium-chain acyl-[acyl-carrier-protein] hydrolase